jgi:hypothetical protein
MTVNLDCLIFFDCFSKRAHLRRPGQLIRSTRGADQGSVDRQDHGRESCVSRHARAGPLARRASTLARTRGRRGSVGTFKSTISVAQNANLTSRVTTCSSTIPRTVSLSNTSGKKNIAQSKSHRLGTAVLFLVAIVTVFAGSISPIC